MMRLQRFEGVPKFDALVERIPWTQEVEFEEVKTQYFRHLLLNFRTFV